MGTKKLLKLFNYKVKSKVLYQNQTQNLKYRFKSKTWFHTILRRSVIIINKGATLGKLIYADNYSQYVGFTQNYI